MKIISRVLVFFLLCSTHLLAQSYTTNFPFSEDPISEGGKWVNGGTTGLDWSNVETTGGTAFGLQGDVSYTDGTALLQGISWGSEQTAQATVYNAIPQPQSCAQEVELRLRSNLSAHSATGYEITWSTGESYFILVRWNGPVGNFTYLVQKSGSQYNIHTGDIVAASITSNRNGSSTIRAYKNGVLQATVNDSTFKTGSPGMGFNLEGGRPGCLGDNFNYGFSNFTAVGTTVKKSSPNRSVRNF